MPVHRSLLGLILVWMLLGCSLAAPNRWVPEERPVAQTPRDATYLIDDMEYVLKEGQVTIETFPGAASKTVLKIYGEPVSGDLDDNGAVDAAIVLVQTTGGSGTFYYVAAALNREGNFVGTRAVLVGDRITPRQLAIRYGVVFIDYADRWPGEAMAMPPSLDKSKYLAIRENRLEEIPLADDELIVAGEVVIGHEVRSFTPCGAGKTAWLAGDSPALTAMQAAYHRAMSDTAPYAKLFMVLTGYPVASPADGLGADYPIGFQATKLVTIRPGEACAIPGQLRPETALEVQEQQ